MKKATIIFLVILYAFSSSGVAVKANYCCDKLQSVKLVLADEAKDKKGCCAIKYQTFKIKDSHAASDVAVTPVLHYIFLYTFNYSFQVNDLVYQNSNRLVDIHAPPLSRLVAAYISNCVFRI